MKKRYRPENEAVRTQIEHTQAQEHATPMYLTSSFTYNDPEEMQKAFAGEIYVFGRITGLALYLFNAWVLSKSMETLGVRMDKHCDNTLTLGKFLSSHSQVEWVKYPPLKRHPQFKIAKKADESWRQCCGFWY